MTRPTNLDPTRKTYDEHAAVIAERFWDTQLDKAWQAFMAALPPQASIIDVGCGPGRDTQHFIEQGHTVFGLDYSAGLLAEAAKRSAGMFIQADMRTLPLAASHFDGAWLSASLLHLQKPDVPGVLKGLHTCLKPGGVVYISLKAGHGEEWEVREGPRFFAYYASEEIEQLITQAGFSLRQTWQDETPKFTWLNLLAEK